MATPQMSPRLSASTADSVPGEVLGEDSEADVHLAARLGLQSEAVGGRGDHFLVLKGRHSSQEESCAASNAGPSATGRAEEGEARGGALARTRQLLAHRAARPPRRASQLVHAGRGGQHAHSVPDCHAGADKQVQRCHDGGSGEGAGRRCAARSGVLRVGRGAPSSLRPKLSTPHTSSLSLGQPSMPFSV